MTAAVQAGAVLDPASGEMVRDATVLVEHGRIAAYGRRGQISVPREAQVIDAAGLTVLPGLIDCHVHLGARGDGLNLAEQLATRPSMWVLNAVPAAAKTLDAGFTTVRDAGGAPAAVRMAIEQGMFPGPRILVAVTALSQTGGHSDRHYACGADLEPHLPDCPSSIVDGVEPMRLRVRELIRAGADWIKLCTSGGVMSPGDSPRHATFTVEEIRAAVTEAAAQGRKVMSHAQATQGIKNALAAGVATIEHGIWLDDAAIQTMLDSGSTLVPTLVAPQWVIRHAESGRVPPWVEEKARLVSADHQRSIKRAIEAKVKIAFGTDTGVGPHGTMGEELLLLHELGMLPLDCIRAATTVAAATIGLEGQVGTLAEGAHADLIGVPGDPLANLELLAKPEGIHLVIKGGQVVKRISA